MLKKLHWKHIIIQICIFSGLIHTAVVFFNVQEDFLILFLIVLFRFDYFVLDVLVLTIFNEGTYSWNQPVQSNKGKVSCSRKQREPYFPFPHNTEL